MACCRWTASTCRGGCRARCCAGRSRYGGPDFPAVIAACAAAAPGREDTWINRDIERLFGELHRAGLAHSVECWLDGALVGGLYGVSLGAAFFGESMFSTARDASKVALVHLVARLRLGGYRLLDTQFVTSHLTQFGTEEVPRERYKAMLAAAVDETAQWRQIAATIEAEIRVMAHDRSTRRGDGAERRVLAALAWPLPCPGLAAAAAAGAGGRRGRAVSAGRRGGAADPGRRAERGAPAMGRGRPAAAGRAGRPGGLCHHRPAAAGGRHRLRRAIADPRTAAAGGDPQTLLAGADARFTRSGTGRVLGMECTEWAVQARHVDATGCVTAGRRGAAGRGHVERAAGPRVALSVARGPVPDAAFAAARASSACRWDAMRRFGSVAAWWRPRPSRRSGRRPSRCATWT